MKNTEAQTKKVSLRLNPLSMHVNPDLFVPASDEEKQELVVLRAGTSLWRDAMRRFRKNKFAMVALGLIILLLLFAFVGPMISQYDYDQFNPGHEDQAPSWQHPFGTDRFGRDLLVRNMYGARISLSIGIIAAVLTLVIGSLYGSISGFVGGRTDNIMMRVIDIIYSLPDLLVVILLSATLKEPLEQILETSIAFSGISELGPAFFSMLIVFALMYWGTMARIVRGEVLRIKERNTCWLRALLAQKAAESSASTCCRIASDPSS